jgi:2-aminoethylphosphonate-pyruvate transaminase
VFQTCIPPAGKVAVLTNGAYGDRMVRMLELARIDCVIVRAEESEPISEAAVARVLDRDGAITHVALVHCETTTGILNPAAEIGAAVKRRGRTFVVDAMSSFGGMPLDLEAWGIDFLVSSANKCIEGVPGFSFVICRRRVLEGCEGWARSLSLDLLGQLRGFDKNGQFRFTPPTHALLAFDRALEELEEEGGVTSRAARYGRNHATLLAGMRTLGLRPFLRPAVQSWIITAFHYPGDRRFSFETLYGDLSRKGFLIYPGKLTRAETFRIGTIGRLFPEDIEQLVFALGGALRAMGVEL